MSLSIMVILSFKTHSKGDCIRQSSDIRQQVQFYRSQQEFKGLPAIEVKLID